VATADPSSAPSALPLRRLLRRPFLVGLAALSAVALTMVGSVVLVVAVLGERVERANETLSALQDGHVAMINQETGLRGFLITREERFLQPYVKGARDHERLDAELWRLAAGDQGLLANLERLDRSQERWIDSWVTPVLAAQPEVDDRQALATLISDDKLLFDDYRTVQDEVREFVEARRDEALSSQRQVLVGGAVTGLLVTAAFALAFRRSHSRLVEHVVPPTQRLREALAGLTAGDLDTRAPENGPVELRDIAGDVNVLAAALQDRDEQVGVRERELVAARDGAERAGQAKTAFLATMSHEIRTPLNAVLGLTDVLLTTPVTDEQRSHLDTIAGSGDSLLALINDILDFSKIEAGELDLECVPFDLAAVVYDVARLLTPQAAGKGLDLLVDIPGDVSWQVVGDSVRLRQVVMNLVGNAVKFTASGHVVVTVRAVPLGGKLTCAVSVADTGIGIAPEHHDRLFRSFTQVDASTTRTYGGTGLGLAISQRIVTAMGGTIDLASEPGAGSVFTVRLTLDVAPGADPVVAARDLAGRRLLLVDDSETNLRILEHQLASFGATCVLATSGAEALELVAADAGFDACLLDLHMPGMDGDVLAARLKELPGTAAVPLVLLSSAAGLRADRMSGFAVRLNKPVRPERLLEAVHAALHQPQAVPAGSPTTRAVPRRAETPLRVLVAEDHAVNAELIGHYLRQLGHSGSFVTDGEQAVQAVLADVFDVVLMDAQMPVLGGVDATAAIRLLHRPQPRIIALTASVLAGDRTAFLAAGADDFLAKPVRLAVLAGALEACRPSSLPIPAAHLPGPPDAGALDADLVDELRDLGDDAFAHLYDRYLDSLVTTVEALLAAADGGVWSEDDDGSVPRLAHRLKGSSASLGAARLAEVCERLQHMDGSRGVDVSTVLSELETESRLVRDAVVALRAG
jgi:signal transduction histidine kinase/DNA-binding response OmpR family regulator/HPt (histidine-containing phosphotransfer) domain-containing protein